MALGMSSIVSLGRRALGLSGQSVTVQYRGRSLHVHVFDDAVSLDVRRATTPGAISAIVLTGRLSGDRGGPSSLHGSMGPQSEMFSTFIEPGTDGTKALERLASEITRRTPFGASARGNVLTILKPLGER